MLKKVVAAGLPRHRALKAKEIWRGKPAATTFFSILLEYPPGGCVYMQGHKDLLVWQKSMDLVTQIYRLTQGFPKQEI
jgi:hypothetical protein